MSTCHNVPYGHNVPYVFWSHDGHMAAMYARDSAGRDYYIGLIDIYSRTWTANGKRWEKWPEGVKTTEEMKAYMETLHRMGEL